MFLQHCVDILCASNMTSEQKRISCCSHLYSSLLALQSLLSVNLFMKAVTKLYGFFSSKKQLQQQQLWHNLPLTTILHIVRIMSQHGLKFDKDLKIHYDLNVILPNCQCLFLYSLRCCCV